MYKSIGAKSIEQRVVFSWFPATLVQNTSPLEHWVSGNSVKLFIYHNNRTHLETCGEIELHKVLWIKCTILINWKYKSSGVQTSGKMGELKTRAHNSVHVWEMYGGKINDQDPMCLTLGLLRQYIVVGGGELNLWMDTQFYRTSEVINDISWRICIHSDPCEQRHLTKNITQNGKWGSDNFIFYSSKLSKNAVCALLNYFLYLGKSLKKVADNQCASVFNN